jgi:spermidine/putrescine transport system substrate-binding protein
MSFSGCGKKKVLRVYNAMDYIDGSVLSAFEKENNCIIEYNNYDNNEDAYSVITSGKLEPYDIVIAREYTISKLIWGDYLQPLNMSLIPNSSGIDALYKNLEFDAGNKFSLPYMVGTFGVLYNSAHVKEPINGWNELWNVNNTAKMVMINSQRDGIAVGLSVLGYSVNSKNSKEITDAKSKLAGLGRYITGYQNFQIKDNMAAERIYLAPSYSGDAYYAIAKAAANNVTLKYELPSGGASKFIDSFAIMRDAKNADLAHKFIDYMCRADVATKNSVVSCYTSAVTAAKAGLPAEMQNSPILYPAKNVWSALPMYDFNLNADELYNKAWLEAKTNKG